MELNLKEWQPSGVEFLRTHPGALLADEQGLGKTVMFINAAKHFNGPVLCVVRSLAKLQMVNEIKRWDPGAPIVRCVEGGLFNEEVVKEWFEFPRKRGYLLVHHEALYRVQSRLRDIGVWEIIWMDEAHRIANPRTQVTKAVKSLRSFYKWATSGTIMDRSPADYWSLLNWFQPSAFPSYWKFYEAHVQEIRNKHTGQIVKRVPKNLTRFSESVGPYFLRRTAQEVGMEEPLYEDIYLEMYLKQAQVYNTLDKETLAFVERESTDDPIFVQNALQKMHLLQRSTISTTLVDSPQGKQSSVKFDWVRDWLVDYSSEQVVIFTHSRAACAELASHLSDFDTAFITGGTPNDLRERYMEMFKDGRTKVLIAVTDLAAESISISWCSNAIFLDCHPSSRLMSQAEMRIRRADSLKRAKIFYLVCNKTVDELLLKHYREKLTNRELVESYLRRHNEGNSH